MANSRLRLVVGTLGKLMLGLGVVGIALIALAAHTVLARVTPQNFEPRLSLLCNSMMLANGVGRTSRPVCDCLIQRVLDEFSREEVTAVADMAVLRFREEIADELAGRTSSKQELSEAMNARFKNVEAQWYRSCHPATLQGAR
jgi:hypothetical protein